jgi:large subunit ribosomal protein L15
MQIHQLKRTSKLKKGKYIGRGGKRGTTAGRGTKGQRARTGHKLRPEIRDVIKKLPKLRGYRFKSRQDKMLPVNLRDIEKMFEAGAMVTPETLVEKKLVNRKGGYIPIIKILGTGNLTKKISFSGVNVSDSAKEKIEKAGGEIK